MYLWKSKMLNTIRTNLFVFQGQLVPLLDWVGFPDLDLWFATEPVDRAAGPTWTWNRQSRHHFPLLAGCHCSLDSFCLWHRTLASIDVHKEPVWRILISSMLYSGETSLIFMSYRYRNLKKIVEKKLRHILHYFVLSKQSKYLLWTAFWRNWVGRPWRYIQQTPRRKPKAIVVLLN